MSCPRLCALALLCCLFAGQLVAQDFGDAPATYGLASAGNSKPEKLGNAWTPDTSNPVSPAWTGDSDDGVAAIPVWQPGTSNNSVTVFVYVGPVAYTEYLALFVDFNDDGDFADTGERIAFPGSPITVDGNYTFNGVAVPIAAYSRNGINKIAVRIVLRYASAPQLPNETFAFGEIEDYLFDVAPLGLFVSTPSALPTAAQSAVYSPVDINAANGTAPYTWTTASGTIPPGMQIAQVGNTYRVSGTPTTVGTYNFTVQVSDAASGVAQRAMQIDVIDAAWPLPFLDDFSTNRNWTLDSKYGITWQRAPCGLAYSPPHGSPEATLDHTPGPDNFILGDNIGGLYPSSVPAMVWAVSPAVNCSGVSNVELRYWRWLNVEQPQFDHAYVDVSGNNGANWTRKWENQAEIADSGWVELRINISAIAGGQAGVRVRFGIGPTDTSFEYGGWCIDDVEIRPLPSTTKLVATQFIIDSPYKVGSNADPRVYTGLHWPFYVTVNNTTANTITVGMLTVSVQEAQGGALQNAGTFTLIPSAPLVVPANTIGMNIVGDFDCTSVTVTGANVTLRGTALLVGTEGATNQAVETAAQETFYIDIGPPPPPPMLEVHEVTGTGPFVDHAQPAAGSARDFGNRDINNGGSQWLNIVLANTLSVPVQVGKPVLAGTDAAHFRLDTAQWTQPVVTLATSGAGSIVFFSVRFDPHDLGPRNAFVQFVHDAPGLVPTPFVVQFTGIGIGNPPELEVHEFEYTGPKVAIGALAAGNRDFGHVALGSSSQWTSFVIWNRFVSSTTINPMPVLSGPNAADFVIDTASLVSPVAGSPAFTGVTFFSVRFAPQTGGNKSASVSFGHNAVNPGGGVFSFEVAGVAIDTPNTPLLAVAEQHSGSPTYRIVNAAPVELGRDFGTTFVSTGPSVTLDIWVNNPGNQALTLGVPAVTGLAASQFALDIIGFSTSLNPGQSTVFQLAFSPNQVGVMTALVTFAHTALTQTSSPFSFEIRGESLPDSPRLDVFEDNVGGLPVPAGAAAPGTGRDFGSRDVNAGASAPRTIMIRNSGSLTMNLGLPVLSGADPGHFLLGTPALVTSLAVGATTTFTVSFDPGSYGAKSAYISFTHNDTTKTSPFQFEVAGFGDSSRLEVHDGPAFGPTLVHDAEPAGTRDFGVLDLGAMPTAASIFTVTNAGNATLTLSPPTLTGPNATSFIVVTSGFPSTLAPGASAAFTIAFNATQVGLKDAQVNIAHDDAGWPTPFVIRITGKATSPNGVRFAFTGPLARGRIGVPYPEEMMSASGGVEPYTWSVLSGSSLPSGLALTAEGLLVGTPEGEAGNFSFAIRVTDVNGGTDDATFSLIIDPAAGSGFGVEPGKAKRGCEVESEPAFPLAIVAVFAAAAIRRRMRQPLP